MASHQLRHDDAEKSVLERMYHATLQGLFGLGFTFSRELQDDSRWLYAIMAFISEAQTLSFVMNDSPLLPWTRTRLFAPIVASISFLSQPFDPQTNPTAYLVVLSVAASFVAGFLGLAVYAARNFVLDLP